jgi:hypothetical protein
MDMFAPEFTRFWLPEAEHGQAREPANAADDERDRREREELALLAERVNAARSVT